MAQKIPPPPQFVGPQWQAFNRWLLELTSILGASGDIDPNSVPGLSGVIAESTANAVAITALQGTTGAQGEEIIALQNDVIAIDGQLTTLGARAQVLNGAVAPDAGLGNVNDWYADTVAKHVYVKTAIATWTLIL